MTKAKPKVAKATVIALDATDVRAVMLCAAKDDVRYYLNGLLVDVDKKQVLLVATDGHRLAVAHRPRDGNTTAPVGTSLIIPSNTLNPFAKAKGPLCLKLNGAAAYTLTDGVTTVDFKPIDGKFPDYRRAIPTTCNGEPATLNLDYVYDFQRAQRLYNKDGPSPSIEYNGNSAALVHGVAPHYLGVIMPMRGSTFSPGAPDWLNASGRPEPVAAPGVAVENEKPAEDPSDIKLYFHCKKCIEEMPPDENSLRYWSRIGAGWTDKGLQIWCNRHDGNVAAFDFKGQRIDYDAKWHSTNGGKS